MDELKLVWALNLFGCGFALYGRSIMALGCGIAAVCLCLASASSKAADREEVMACIGLETVSGAVCGILLEQPASLVLIISTALTMELMKEGMFSTKEKKGLVTLGCLLFILAFVLHNSICTGYILFCVMPFIMKALFVYAAEKDLQEIHEKVK